MARKGRPQDDGRGTGRGRQRKERGAQKGSTGRGAGRSERGRRGGAGPLPERLPEGACLSLVGTPLGNLADLSERAAETLAAADAIAAEDTRVIRRLLSLKGLEARGAIFSCRAENEAAAAARILCLLAEGRRVALVSDAGMPLVSDPGALAVRETAERGGRVEVVPGPSAPSAALAAAGFGGKGYIFLGFASKRAGRVRRALEEAAAFPGPLVLFENPHRAVRTLGLAAEALGPREAAACFELTKRFERVRRGRLPELAASLAAEEEAAGALRGEVTLVIAGAKRAGEEEDGEGAEGEA